VSDSRLFRAALQRSDRCPPQAVLERHLERHDAALSAHIDRCAFCKTEIELLRSFVQCDIPAEDAAAVDAIVQRLDQRPPPLLERRKPWWSFDLSWVRATALAAAAILVAVGIGLQLRSGPPALRVPDAKSAGVYRSHSVAILSPSGDLQTPPAEARWESTPAAANYRVRLLEVDGNELWSSTATGTTIAFPASIRALMVPAKTLALTVDAFNAQNQKIAESSKVNFRILQKIYGR
jgi:hypothetical protein